MLRLSGFGIFNVRTDADACDCTGGCTNAVKESICLEADSGRKIPCRTGDWNPRQYRAWLFSRALYQLSYSRTQMSSKVPQLQATVCRTVSNTIV